MVRSNHQGPSPLAWASESPCGDSRSKARSVDEYAGFAAESIPLTIVSSGDLGSVAVAWRGGLLIDTGSSRMPPTLDTPSRPKALATLPRHQGDCGQGESTVLGRSLLRRLLTAMGLLRREFPRNISAERAFREYASRDGPGSPAAMGGIVGPRA
jgi:hypothetical protein